MGQRGNHNQNKKVFRIYNENTISQKLVGLSYMVLHLWLLMLLLGNKKVKKISKLIHLRGLEKEYKIQPEKEQRRN